MSSAEPILTPEMAAELVADLAAAGLTVSVVHADTNGLGWLRGRRLRPRTGSEATQ